MVALDDATCCTKPASLSLKVRLIISYRIMSSSYHYYAPPCSHRGVAAFSYAAIGRPSVSLSHAPGTKTVRSRDMVTIEHQ